MLRKAPIMLLTVIFAIGATACGPAKIVPVGKPETKRPANTSAGKTGSGHVGKAVVITIREFAFWPAQARAKAGQKVVWVNKDRYAHNIHFDDAHFKSRDVRPGERFDHVISKPGKYGYHCHLHPSLRGALTVK